MYCRTGEAANCTRTLTCCNLSFCAWPFRDVNHSRGPFIGFVVTRRMGMPKLHQARMFLRPYGRHSGLKRLCIRFWYERCRRARVGRPDLWAAQYAMARGQSWRIVPMRRKSFCGCAASDTDRQCLLQDAWAKGQGGSQVARSGPCQSLSAYSGRGKRRHEFSLAIGMQNAMFGGALTSRIWVPKTAFLTVLYRAHIRATSGNSPARGSNWRNSTFRPPVPPVGWTAICRSATSARAMATRVRRPNATRRADPCRTGK